MVRHDFKYYTGRKFQKIDLKVGYLFVDINLDCAHVSLVVMYRLYSKKIDPMYRYQKAACNFWLPLKFLY